MKNQRGNCPGNYQEFDNFRNVVSRKLEFSETGECAESICFTQQKTCARGCAEKGKENINNEKSVKQTLQTQASRKGC